jgi:hypothetical protein
MKLSIWHVIRYGAITTSELWKMPGPHSVVLEATVNKYYWLALAEFDISKLGAVGGDPFDFIRHSQDVQGSASD